MEFLDGITVVDATQVVAGPVVTMHLGDLGAEVVKLERPEGGDISRSLGPHVGEDSSQFASLNRNKHSVAVDLRSAAGQRIARDLVREADVFVENYKAGSAASLGLDYDTLSEANPDLVYCSIKGFDRDSAYAGDPAYDMVAQAMGGIMSVTGQPDGPPTWVGAPIGDLAASMYAIQSILGALFHREFRDGGGEFVEVSMLNATVAWLGVRLTAGGVEGEPYPRLGNQHPNVAPYKVFETADGHVVAAVVGDDAWDRFCTAIDRDDLREDARFATAEDRSTNQEALYDRLDDVFRERSTEEWVDCLRAHGVPTGPVMDTSDIIESEYTRSRNLVQSLPTPSGGADVPVPRYPANLGSVAEHAPAAPPAHGEDTATYLRALGYSPEQIDELAAQDVVHLGD